MRNSLFILFVLAASTIFGQLTSDVDTIYKPEISSASEIISEITIFNNTTDSVVTWTRINENIPEGWFSAACDEEVCYFPQTSTGESVIKPGDSAMFRAYFYAESGDGIGEVNFSFKTKSNPSDSLVVNFIGSSSPDGSPVPFDQLTGLFKTSLSHSSVFYPTVSENGIFNTNDDVESIKVLNVNGSELLFKEGSALSTINLSTFSKGVYFLIIDGIKTQRVVLK